ncbi:MAG: flagellar basal body P-ring formation chaperone FlgA [Pseudomonadota bacterium]
MHAIEQKRHRVTRSWRSFLWGALGCALVGTLPVLGLCAARSDVDSLKAQLADRVQVQLEERYPQATVGVEVPSLPPYLVQNPCAAFDVEVPETAPRKQLAVRLRCVEGAAWVVYARVRVSLLRSVPTTCTALPRNHRIRSVDLCPRSLDVAAHNPRLVLDGASVATMETRRALPAGSPLDLGGLQPAQLVRRGDEVQLEAGSSRLRIRALASALQPGRLGQQISVRNLRSGKRVRAWVVGQGRVSTAPPNP